MKWRCTVCNYIHDGDSPPDVCPICGAPKEKFVKVEADESNLIERSRMTNELHMELATTARHLVELAEVGIEDDLDPGCVRIFKRAKEWGSDLAKAAMAEIKVHVGKGKWG